MNFPKFQRMVQLQIVNAPAIRPDQIFNIVQDTIDQVFPRSEDRSRQAATPKIAIGVGSRGIANIAKIVKAVIDVFSARGYNVFIVPAMGSHGGSNAEGQTATLAHYEITEARMQVPIRASMKTVEATRIKDIAIGCAEVAWQQDTLLFPVGRVKPHTNILAKDTQSGLRKMLAIGFGKRDYAQYYHGVNGTNGLGPVIDSVTEALVATGRVLGGLAIVEGPNHGTHLLEGVAADAFMTREPELLTLANDLMPSLPFRKIGVLHLGQIGKAISGSSADPNVTSLRLDGSQRVEGKGQTPIHIVCASEPHPDTEGNLIGINGLDVVTQTLADAIGEATFENGRSAGNMEACEPRRTAQNDREMLEWAIGQMPERLPIVSVKDTLSLGKLIVDEQTAVQFEDSADVQFQGPSFDVEFDAGRLVNFWSI